MKTLSRPMFRRGGSTGEGITSGLSRPGYNRGRVVNPGGYQGDPNLDPSNLLKGYPAFKKEYQSQVGDRPRSTNLNDFLINFGLDIASRPPQGGLLSTAAASAKDPFAQFQQRKAYEQEAPREEERDLVKAYMSARGEALSGGKEYDEYKDAAMARLEKEALSKMYDLNQKWKPEWNNMSEDELTKDKDYQDWQKEKSFIVVDLSHYGADTSDITDLISGDVLQTLQEGYRQQLQESEEEMTVEDPDNPGETMTITEGEFYSDGANKGALAEKIIALTQNYIRKEREKKRGWLGATGGRAGYQGGRLVEQEDVNVMTPRGDVAMQETVEEGAEPDQLSYEELRSRLPVEITDDIIRLMVSSTEALTDFAQIQTQQDVDNFNAKYGVNLVLPSEA